ncbi:MAG: hypothetical protein ABEJ65_11560 [bacterium]
MGKQEESPALRKRVKDLETGHVVARDVYTPDDSHLFSQGHELNAEDIQRLKDWNVRYVHIIPPDQMS